MAPTLRGIVFDLWNTLAHDPGAPNPVRLLAGALGIDAEPGWKRRLERGMMLAPAAGIEGALRQLRHREGLSVADAATREQVIRCWSNTGSRAVLYDDVLPQLRRLRRRFRLGLCSNTQSFGLEFLGRSGLLEHLDATALSFEVGALKPRAEIFRAVLGRLNLAPETVLMVGDDLRDDVGGARRLGMRAVHLMRPGGGGSGSVVSDAAEPMVHGLEEMAQHVELMHRNG